MEGFCAAVNLEQRPNSDGPNRGASFGRELGEISRDKGRSATGRTGSQHRGRAERLGRRSKASGWMGEVSVWLGMGEASGCRGSVKKSGASGGEWRARLRFWPSEASGGCGIGGERTASVQPPFFSPDLLSKVKCFNTPLLPSEIVEVKMALQEMSSKAVNEHGLILTGFLFLHKLFIQIGHPDTIGNILRKFGYDNDIKLSENLITCSFKRSPDQSVELTNEAIEYLKGIFELFDIDKDGALRPTEIEDLFSTAPEFPWNEAPYKDAAEKTALGGLSLDGFLSHWALMALLDPARTLENLICIGYPDDPSSAIRVTKMRRYNRKKQQSDRNVFQCLVFGPKKAGK